LPQSKFSSCVIIGWGEKQREVPQNWYLLEKVASEKCRTFKVRNVQWTMLNNLGFCLKIFTDSAKSYLNLLPFGIS
jgi:hypothetical protein